MLTWTRVLYPRTTVLEEIAGSIAVAAACVAVRRTAGRLRQFSFANGLLVALDAGNVSIIAGEQASRGVHFRTVRQRGFCAQTSDVSVTSLNDCLTKV